MGCNACKVGSEDQQKYQTFYGTGQKNDNSLLNAVLSQNDRQIWEDNLKEPSQPDSNFWGNNSQATHSCFTQIKKDITRSFPTSRFFQSKNNIDRFQLLLKKFAIYFPKVGYTQGLNFLAGYLLIAGFDDENAFKLLVRLALNQKLMFIGLYEQNFPLNRLYCQVFWKLLEKRQHNTAAKIKIANVMDQIWIFQWFMTCFLYSFPVEYVKKFFDYVICKKQFALVTLALGIVNCLKNDITNMKNPDQFDFFQFLDNLKNPDFCTSKISIEKVIVYANSITKHQISKALEQIKMSKNIYYTYFRRENQRSQIWGQINQKFTRERRMFQYDPKSSQYIRDLDSVEHLERLLLKKSRLYKSRTDSKFSSQIRTSNFTVDIDPVQQVRSVTNQIRFLPDTTHNFFRQYGGIKEQVQAQQKRERQMWQNRFTNRNKIQQIYDIRTNTRQDTTNSKDSRNQIKSNY